MLNWEVRNYYCIRMITCSYLLFLDSESLQDGDGVGTVDLVGILNSYRLKLSTCRQRRYLKPESFNLVGGERRNPLSEVSSAEEISVLRSRILTPSPTVSSDPINLHSHIARISPSFPNPSTTSD